MPATVPMNSPAPHKGRQMTRHTPQSCLHRPTRMSSWTSRTFSFLGEQACALPSDGVQCMSLPRAVGIQIPVGAPAAMLVQTMRIPHLAFSVAK